MSDIYIIKTKVDNSFAWLEIKEENLFDVSSFINLGKYIELKWWNSFDDNQWCYINILLVLKNHSMKHGEYEIDLVDQDGAEQKKNHYYTIYLQGLFDM